MKLGIKYTLLLLFCFLQIHANNPYALQEEKKVDSLLKASTSRVYENPDSSIDLGLAVYNNENFDLKTRTRALILTSLAYTSKRDYKKALQYILQANTLSKPLKDNVLQTEILFKIGILYQQLKIFDKSIDYLEQTEKLALFYPVRDSVRRFLASSYVVKGFIYKDNLNCDIALEFFNKGIKEYNNLNDPLITSNLSIVNYNKGNCYTLLSDFDNAKSSFNKAILLAKSQQANSLISFAQKGLAEVYTLEGKYQQAIQLLQIAQEQSKDVGDLVLNQGIYEGLFKNYLALNQWDDYKKYHDLYLTTQLKVKVSERNSISDSIEENQKNTQQASAVSFHKFKNNMKWLIAVLLVLFIAILVLFHFENKKRKEFQLELEQLQK